MGDKHRSGLRTCRCGGSHGLEYERIEDAFGRRPQIVHSVVPCNPDDSGNRRTTDGLDILTVEHRGETDPAIRVRGAACTLDLGCDEPFRADKWVVFGESGSWAVAQTISGASAQLRDPIGVAESEQWAGIGRQSAVRR